MENLIEPLSNILPLPFVLEALHLKAQFHQQDHGCGAYTFNDGAGLMALCKAAQAQRILELGCGIGFTSACMALALPKVKIDTIDADSKHVELARQNLIRLKQDHNVLVHEGYFDDVISGLSRGYDLIFFDGYSPSLTLLKKLILMLSDNGLLVCANLTLLSNKERAALMDFFNTSPLASCDVTLENGGTVVARKKHVKRKPLLAINHFFAAFSDTKTRR
jgi:predicted O-methyltransferase YrrM